MKKNNNIKKQGKSVLKILIPDHVKRTTENSDWCGTVKVFTGKDKRTKQIVVKK